MKFGSGVARGVSLATDPLTKFAPKQPKKKKKGCYSA